MAPANSALFLNTTLKPEFLTVMLPRAHWAAGVWSEAVHRRSARAAATGVASIKRKELTADLKISGQGC